MKIVKPSFIKTKKEFYQYIIDNEQQIINEKKSHLKNFVFSLNVPFEINENKEGVSQKAYFNGILPKNTDSILYATIVGNTSNVMDSHGDNQDHNCWNKTLSDSKKSKRDIPFKNQHRSGIENNLMINCNPYVKEIFWRDLNVNKDGVTTCLLADIAIDKGRVPDYIWKGFINGEIKQFSVGMQYVKLVTCINDPDYKDAFANWNTYFPLLLNQQEAEDEGMFWQVLECKLFEISCVERGSCPVTGVIDDNSQNKELQTNELEIIKNEILLLKNDIEKSNIRLNALKNDIENNKPQTALEIDKIDEPQIEIEKSEEKPDVNEINKLLNLIKF